MPDSASDPYTVRHGEAHSPPRTFAGRLKYLGPSLVVSGAVIGSGELVLTTTLGATAGWSLLWFLLLSCWCKSLVQAELARYTIVSGDTYYRAINRVPGRIGRVSWTVWISIIAYFPGTMGLGGILGGAGEAMSFLASLANVDTDAESFAAARELLIREGLLAGSSTGTMLEAALRYCREQTEAKRVVTLACDTGSRYLSKLYNDFWMEDQGFTERTPTGNLLDLVGRPHEQHATITVGPTDVLTTAHNRLRNAGISQLPVMDENRLVGVLTEDDIIRHVFGHPGLMKSPVGDAMHTAFVSVDKDMPLNTLVSILQAQPYAAVNDGDLFLGLITRSDMLNHLRKQVQ